MSNSVQPGDTRLPLLPGSERLVRIMIPMIDGFDAFRAAMVILELPDFLGNSRPTQRDAGELLGHDLIERIRAAYDADYQFNSMHDHLKALALH